MIKGKRRGLLLVIILAAVGIGALNISTMAGKIKIGDEVNLSTQAQKHILYGNNRGGGHKYGVGKPCKSEFPKDWNDAKIIETVKTFAANDNMNWKQGRNGYFTADTVQDGVKVRVVLDREKDDVVTAYPLNTRRNPCNIETDVPEKLPSPANDNITINE